MSFKKGQSGNPAGRKPGTTAGSKIRQAIEESRDDIIKAVIDAAKGGDMSAAKMLLDRICPTLRPVIQPVVIPVNDEAGLSDKGDEVIKSAMAGQVPPDIANMFITALAAQARIIETAELIERIEKLEERINESKK
jgi:hypothetical protein